MDLSTEKNYSFAELFEKHVTVAQMVDEIFPLMEECFSGELVKDPRGIKYRLPNGQRFFIMVKPMAR